LDYHTTTTTTITTTMSSSPPPVLEIEVELGFGAESRKEKRKDIFVKTIFEDLEDHEARIDQYKDEKTGALVVHKETFLTEKEQHVIMSRIDIERQLYNKIKYHPRIVQFLGYYLSASKNPVLIFPMLREDPLPLTDPSLLKRYFQQVLEAISHLASCNIIHGNIKPDNIMFNSETKNIIFIDFGESFFHTEQYPYKPAGSGIYEAPEQQALRFGPKADIWSTGITFAELLLGQIGIIKQQTPHPIQTIFKLRFHQRDLEREKQQNKTAFWDSFRPAGCTLPYNLTPEAEDFLFHLTRFNPEKRFSAAEALNHHYLK